MKKVEPDIAIIVPVYNAKKNLKKCIRSILGQEFRNFSLILVDDGSKDNSGQICEEFAREDDRIHVIHQFNQGCAMARRNGTLSVKAQSAKYIMYIDSDDAIPADALMKLYKVAEQFESDCVCGRQLKLWKGIKFTTYNAPCFQIKEPMIYETKEIIEKLYVSCFGISDFPVSLYMKLYKKELIMEVMEMDNSNLFFGEDLNITIRLMPLIQRLVIIPDVVYFYRIGGGTSKFMPNMLKDSLELYRCKQRLQQEYPMPFDTELLISIELMNIVKDFLVMCVQKGKYSFSDLQKEIEEILCMPEIISSAYIIKERAKNHHIAMLVNCGDAELFRKYIEEESKKNIIKRQLKKFILSI